MPSRAVESLDFKPWPLPGSWKHVYRGGERGGKRQRYYQTDDGTFPGATTILDAVCLGGKAFNLMRWAAKLEHEATVDAACWTYARACNAGDVVDFRAELLSVIPEQREHQRQAEAAGDVGTEVHEAIAARLGRVSWGHPGEIGDGESTPVSEKAAPSVNAWVTWARADKQDLLPVRIEQPVWSAAHHYAGTIDLIAQKPEGLWLYDWKSGSGIYESEHMQLAAYVRAASQHAEIAGASFVHCPKDGKPAKEVPLGRISAKRSLSLDELLAGFDAAHCLFKLFAAKEPS